MSILVRLALPQLRPDPLEAAWRRYLALTTPEQGAEDFRRFKCGGCTMRDTCPSSPVCPSSEDE